MRTKNFAAGPAALSLPCCPLKFFCALTPYPAVLTLLCSYPALRLPLTLLCPYFFSRLSYSAVPLDYFFFIALTLLALKKKIFFFAPTLLPLFFCVRSNYLPCCALIFLRTYPTVPLFFYALALHPYFILTYPDVRLFFCVLTLLCCYFTFTYPAVPLSRFTITTGYFWAR